MGKIRESRDRITLFHIISMILILFLIGSYFFNFMYITIDQEVFSLINLILVITQLSLLLAISITYLIMANVKSKITFISALTGFSLYPISGILLVISFIRSEDAYFSRFHINSDLFLSVVSFFMLVFLTFYWYFDSFEKRELILSAVGFLWTVSGIAILLWPSLSQIGLYSVNTTIFILFFLPMIIFFFFSDKFNLFYSRISFSLFLILLFNYYFGSFVEIQRPYSIAGLYSHSSSVIGYLFGFYSLIKSIALHPRELLKGRVAERENIITSLQSIVSHDATNYLSTAISFIDVAIDNESTEFMEKALNPIEKTIILLDSTSNLTKQFMDYSKKKEKLSSIIKQICIDLEQDKESYGIKKVDFNITVEDISLDSHPLITGVIKNILENALKYASGDEARIDITSTITQTKNLEMLNLIFEDYGQGINPTRRKKLLKQPVDSKKGHGFGLFLYNFLIDKILGGSISLEERVRDDYKKGTRMIVSIPLEQ